MRELAVMLALLTAACVHRPVVTTYRLLPRDPGTMLVPPEVTTPEIGTRRRPTDIRPGKGTCTAESPLLKRRGRRIEIQVDRDALTGQKQPGWLSNWTVQAEAHGCIAEGEGIRLANLIVESLPLDPQVAFRLLHANDVQSGYVDLGPENRVEVRSAVLQEGAPGGTETYQTQRVTGSGAQLTVEAQAAPALAGFEIAWYAVRPRAGQAGFRFEALSADRTTRSGVEHLATPAANHLTFGQRAAYYRLFYKTDDNGVTAMVIAGETRSDLDRRTQAVQADAAVCQKDPELCVVLPKRVGINPFLVITVNGKDVPVPLGATVRGAMQAGGLRTDAVPPTLTVSRPYGGQLRPVEFDRTRPEILSLKLNGGESLTW